MLQQTTKEPLRRYNVLDNKSLLWPVVFEVRYERKRKKGKKRNKKKRRETKGKKREKK